MGATLPTGSVFADYQHFNVLLGTARTLVDRQPEAAVAVAQMAFESFVGFAVVNLLRFHGVSSDLCATLAGCVGGSLMAKPDREAWRVLSGQKLDSKSTGGAFPRYQQHIERRNEAVHLGKPSTEAEAEQSIEAVQNLMNSMIAAARDRTNELLAKDEPEA